jgi:hypothetical protein
MAQNVRSPIHSTVVTLTFVNWCTTGMYSYPVQLARVSLLRSWMRILQRVAEAVGQHGKKVTDIHPCSERDSNPLSSDRVQDLMTIGTEVIWLWYKWTKRKQEDGCGRTKTKNVGFIMHECCSSPQQCSLAWVSGEGNITIRFSCTFYEPLW